MRIEVGVEVAAPQAQVFEVFADLGRAAERISGIERVEILTPGPVGRGTRWRETRRMFGKEDTVELAITAFEPPRSYAVEAHSCGAHFRSEFRFEARPTGTAVTLTTVGRPVTLLARLLTPLSCLMKGSMRKALQKDLDDLKRAAEAHLPA